MAGKTKTKVETVEETTEEREHIVLDITPEEFEVFAKTLHIRSSELCAKITARFKSVFTDYTGTWIEPTGNGKFNVTLIFEKDGSGSTNAKINALSFVNKKATSTERFGYGMDTLAKYKSGKTYELTEDAKDILTPYMTGWFQQQKSKNKWDQVYMERRVPADRFRYNQQSERVLFMINQSVDINRLLTLIYGNKIVVSTVEDNGKIINKTRDCHYNARINRYTTDGMDIILNIEQFDYSAIEEIVRKENPIPMNNTVRYY